MMIMVILMRRGCWMECEREMPSERVEFWTQDSAMTSCSLLTSQILASLWRLPTLSGLLGWFICFSFSFFLFYSLCTCFGGYQGFIKPVWVIVYALAVRFGVCFDTCFVRCFVICSIVRFIASLRICFGVTRDISTDVHLTCPSSLFSIVESFIIIHGKRIDSIYLQFPHIFYLTRVHSFPYVLLIIFTFLITRLLYVKPLREKMRW